ncbi:MAG: hypothetical protein WCH86_01425 [Kiritimatiellales bacterium]
MRGTKEILTAVLFLVADLRVSAAEISGRILYEGSPVTNATVEVWQVHEISVGWSMAAPVFWDGVVNADGSFVINVSPGSNYVVQVIPDITTGLLPAFYSAADSLWDADRIATADDKAANHIDFQLQQGAQISGIVTAGLLPVSNASVRVSKMDGSSVESSRTDSNGVYKILVAPGTNYIAEVDPDSDSGWLGEYYNNSESFEEATPFVATIDSPAKNINFDLEPAARISGVVRFGSNTVSSAYVNVYQKVYLDFSDRCNYEFVGSGAVGPDGFYSAWVPPGSNYVVKAAPYSSTELLSEYYGGARVQEDAQLLTVTVEVPLENVDFDLDQGAWISGFVMSGADPEMTARIKVYGKWYDERILSWNYSLINTEYTDQNGAYSVLVPPGSNYVVFASPGYSSGAIQSISFGAAEIGLYYDGSYPQANASWVATSVDLPAKNINFDLNHLPVISGKVMSGGIPVAHAIVNILQKTSGQSDPFSMSQIIWVTSAEVEADGSYSVRLVPGTNYIVGVTTENAPPFLPEFYNHARSLQDTETLSVALDVSAVGIDFDLSVGFRIQGTVKDESGCVVQTPYVSVQDSFGRSLNSAQGETNGWYSIYAPTGELVFVSAWGMDVEWELYRDSKDLDNAEPLSGGVGDTVIANFILFRSDTDSDGDGIPDYQEERVPDGIYQQGVDYSDLNAPDTDHDGFNDWQEKQCKTDPANEADYLRIADSVMIPDGMILRWMSVPGVQYFVERCTDLSVDEWEEIAGPINGDGTLIQFVAPVASKDRAFYRVCVRNP